MRISDNWLRKIAGCLVMLLTMPFADAATVRPRQTAPAQQAAGASSGQPESQNSGSGTSNPAPAATQASPDDANAVRLENRDGQAGTSSSAPEQQQKSTSQPVGTAAAPYEKMLGVPASRPAGAVIAPAKQRRTRSILIRVGVILAAGVAVGIVVGLSKASPSRPK
jgi:hypothetical protein